MGKYREKADAAFETVVGGLSRSRFGQGVNALSKKQAPDWLANSGDAVYNAGSKIKNYLVGEGDVPEGDFTKMKRQLAMNKGRGRQGIAKNKMRGITPLVARNEADE